MNGEGEMDFPELAVYSLGLAGGGCVEIMQGDKLEQHMTLLLVHVSYDLAHLNITDRLY